MSSAETRRPVRVPYGTGQSLDATRRWRITAHLRLLCDQGVGRLRDRLRRHAITVQQETGRAGGGELWDSQELDLDWMILDHRFRDRTSKTASDSGFLGRNDATGFPGCLQHGLSIQRLHC